MARPNLPEDERKALKETFVNYFRDVPVQKYAAMYIGVSENTITNWLKEDKQFYDDVSQARADWVKKQVIRSKAEFKLERMESEIFKQRTESDVHLDLPAPILGGSSVKDNVPNP